MVERRYSPVARSIWGHRKFRRLSKAKPNGQTLALRLIVAPEATSVPGLFKARAEAIAADLGWPLAAFRKCLREVLEGGWARYDEESGVFWIPGSIDQEANQPANPNVVRGWRTPLAELPDCPLKEAAIEALGAWAEAKGRAWAEAFDEALGKRKPMASPNPSGKGRPKPLVEGSAKQEQEQEQEQEAVASQGSPGAPERRDRPAAAARPTNFDSAMRLPVRERAAFVEREKHLAGWTEPHRWPEVRALAERIQAAQGLTAPSLGSYERDPGVRNLVALLATFDDAELASAVGAIPGDPWFTTRRGLSAISPEVIRRLADPRPEAPRLPSRDESSIAPATAEDDERRRERERQRAAQKARELGLEPEEVPS